MYTPAFNAVTDEAEARAMVAAVGSAQLITVGPDGVPAATLLPVLWHPASGPEDRHGVVEAHFARANPHWQTITDGSPALMVCALPEAYVSPSWYASKAEHGRVVPTWNYAAVHLTGTVSVHQDPERLRASVARLTERHEQGRPAPWSLDDAPDAFVTGKLRGIVGVEVRVERVEAKAKLSQNRSLADRTGVVEGLRAEGTPGASAVAAAMAAAIDDGSGG